MNRLNKKMINIVYMLIVIIILISGCRQHDDSIEKVTIINEGEQANDKLIEEMKNSALSYMTSVEGELSNLILNIEKGEQEQYEIGIRRLIYYCGHVEESLQNIRVLYHGPYMEYESMNIFYNTLSEYLIELGIFEGIKTEQLVDMKEIALIIEEMSLINEWVEKGQKWDNIVEEYLEVYPDNELLIRFNDMYTTYQFYNDQME